MRGWPAASVPEAVPAHIFAGNWVWWMWLMMAVGMSAMVIAIVAVAWLVVRALRDVVGRPGERSREDRAVEELRVRYARGEITTEEFAERRRELGHPG